MNRHYYLLAALASGLLLWAGWPPFPSTLLLFFAWTPLLWLETRVANRAHFFGYTYLTMFVWNVSSTWWIWNASVPGSIAAFVANSFLMCLPWLGYKIVRKRLGANFGYLSLLSFWMCFEYIHLMDWGLSWPWLTLGNAFAANTDWVQWYSYTGSSGGSLWILLSNILLFTLFTEYRQHGRSPRYLAKMGLWLFLVLAPALASRLMTPPSVSASAQKNVVLVQPNIDPYEKVTSSSLEEQLQLLIRLSEKAIDNSTALLVWPETALYTANGIDEENMQANYYLAPLWNFLKSHPHISLFTGVESYRAFDQPTPNSQAYNGMHYESYNGSVLMDSSGATAFYHKSMLVPGVETLPWFLKFIDRWFEKFGGTTAGYTRQGERTVLSEKNGYRIAPAICYESIYGEFMSRYIRNGANIICIITNDGWWKKTPGHRQHMLYARLRAIETRTWIARSANTGISCFIDPAGNILQPQGYDTQAVIKQAIPAIHRETFYVRYGDLLSALMVLLSAILIAWTFARKIGRSFRKLDEPLSPDKN